MFKCLQLLCSVILQWVCTKGYRSTNIMPPWREFTGQRVTASINHEWLCLVTKYLGGCAEGGVRSLQHAAGSLLLGEEQIGANAEWSRELEGADAGRAQDLHGSSSRAATLRWNRSWWWTDSALGCYTEKCFRRSCTASSSRHAVPETEPGIDPQPQSHSAHYTSACSKRHRPGWRRAAGAEDTSWRLQRELCWLHAAPSGLQVFSVTWQHHDKHTSVR